MQYLLRSAAELSFEWDPEKDRTNAEKHGLSLTDTTAVFDDVRHVVLAITRHELTENRYKVVGLIDDRLWTLVVTLRGDSVRLISARRPHDDEIRAYRSGPEAG